MSRKTEKVVCQTLLLPSFIAHFLVSEIVNGKRDRSIRWRRSFLLRSIGFQCTVPSMPIWIMIRTFIAIFFCAFRIGSHRWTGQ